VLAFVAVASSVKAEEGTTGSATHSPTSAEERARQAFEAGEAAYERKDFVTAAAEFQRAYSIVPSPRLLYDMAQAERLAGQCGPALKDYEQFVMAHTGEVPADIDDKIAEVAQCSASQSTEAPRGQRHEAPQLAPPPALVTRATSPIPDRREQMPAWIGWTATGVGVAGLVAGTIMATMVVHRQSVVESTCPGKVCRDQSGIDAAAEGRALLVGSIASYAVGAVGIGFGVYVLAHDSSVPMSAAHSATTAPTGAVVSWRTAL
jgi:hypothetical protein